VNERFTFVTEVGSPTLEMEVVLRIRDGLRTEGPVACQSRAFSAADAIDAALNSDRRVQFQPHTLARPVYPQHLGTAKRSRVAAKLEKAGVRHTTFLKIGPIIGTAREEDFR
jgi:hypothetical protein